MTYVYPPTAFTVPLSPCGEVLLGEDCGHGAGCPPPEVAPPANPQPVRHRSWYPASTQARRPQ